MSTLRAGYPALISRGAEGVIRGVDGWAARQQCTRQGWTPVICQRTDLSSTVDQVTRRRVAAVILDQVVPTGNNVARGARGKLFAGVPVVAGNDRVCQREGGHEAAAELADEERGWSIVRGDVVRDSRVGDRDVPVGLEDRSTMPASRSVAAERTVRDGHVPQGTDGTANIVGHVSADRTADDGGCGVEE